MEIERYSHVMHLVSCVEGDSGHRRAPGTPFLLPGGNGVGRAEDPGDGDHRDWSPRRGDRTPVQWGTSFAGDLDICITIRTLVVGDGQVSVTAGAGIVADSIPESEERETENKAAALMAAVNLAER